MLTTAASRLAVAALPYSLVFHLAGDAPARAGVLVAAHALGEVTGAPACGRRATGTSARSFVFASLLTQGLFILPLALLPADGSRLTLLVGLAFAAGVSGSGVPGALRASAVENRGGSASRHLFAVDNAIGQLAWCAAPAATWFIAVQAGGAYPILAVSVVSFAGAAAALNLSRDRPVGRTLGRGPRGSMAALWSGLAATILSRAVLGALIIVVPNTAALQSMAGFLLTLYAAMAAVAGAASTRWPLRPVGLSGISLLVALEAGVAAAGLTTVHSGFGLVLLVVALGAFEGIVAVALLLHFQGSGAPGSLARQFSYQYAAIGVGFALGGLAVSALSVQLQAAIAAAVALGVVATLALALAWHLWRSPP